MVNLFNNRDIPIPPLKMRKLVGDFRKSSYDNPEGKLVFPYIEKSAYNQVLDFGCGCGRLTRKLMQQKPRPHKYVGLDLHRGMINWCQNNLHPLNRNFEFFHYDIYNPGLNPQGSQSLIDFPKFNDKFSLAFAISVFTHITEPNVDFFLNSVVKSLNNNGLFLSTWFLFEKQNFPMMQKFQNSLYINLDDPTNAVIYDKEWLIEKFLHNGLSIEKIIPPTLRGFHWYLLARKDNQPHKQHFPLDNAEFGSSPPPLLEKNAHLFGTKIS